MFYKRDDSENTADCPISPPSAIRDESVKWKRYTIARSLNNLWLCFEWRTKRLVENARYKRKLLRSGEREESSIQFIVLHRHAGDATQFEPFSAVKSAGNREWTDNLQRRVTVGRRIDGWSDAPRASIRVKSHQHGCLSRWNCNATPLNSLLSYLVGRLAREQSHLRRDSERVRRGFLWFSPGTPCLKRRNLINLCENVLETTD